MEKTRIPKPSSSRIPHSRILPNIPENAAPLRRPNLRRSVSMVDLHRINKPLDIYKKPVKPTATKPQVLPAIRAGQKRPLTGVNKDPVKAKVAKKIPDWDYKSRFNNLNEKFSDLKQRYETLKNRLNDLEHLETQLTELRKTNVSLTAEKALWLREKTEILEEKAFIEKNFGDLEEKFNNLWENHETLTKKHDILSEKVTEIPILKEKVASLISKNETLGRNCSLYESELEELKRSVQNGESIRRQLHNTIQDLKGNIRVFCRIRPPLENEFDKLQCLITCQDSENIEIKKSKESINAITGKNNGNKYEFTFDRVFPQDVVQYEVFEELAQLVQSALDGYNVCVFAYGQTGSGKTYTMQGDDTSTGLGMIPRTIDLIFDTISQMAKYNWEYKVEASFLEIYNEIINDLLVPNSQQKYDIRCEMESKVMSVPNLKTEHVTNASVLRHLMNKALKNRSTAATDFNEHSSRSHAITKISLSGRNVASNTVLKGSLSLVDLAGSESAKTSTEERMTETKNINKSLSTLGSVILALYNKEKHIPYRNSKLTYLLSSCLGGDSKTLMFVNIAPFEECFNETLNSLRFAAKVKEVKTGLKKHKNKLR